MPSTGELLWQVSSKMGVSNGHVRNVAVWGEHGDSSHVDAHHAQIQQLGQWRSLAAALHDDRWLRHDLVKVMYDDHYTNPRPRRTVTTCLENPELSGNLTVVTEMSEL